VSDWMEKPLRDRMIALYDCEANETAATIGEAIDQMDTWETALREIAAGHIDEGGNRRNHNGATAIARKVLRLDRTQPKR